MNMKLSYMSIFMFLFCFFEHSAEANKLSYNFYTQSCPQVENIVRYWIRTVSLVDPTTPASLLRLMFHDCQVQGCDASILLDQDGYSEMDSSKNFGIKKREVISKIKSAVEAVCPVKVSCADILVLAARDAIALSGGPTIPVPLGRKDSSSFPNFRLADASLPPADIGVDGMLQVFTKKGMTVEESVAILGAHTLGVTHCVNLQSRLYSSKFWKINLANSVYVNELRLSCPLGSLASKISFVPNDLTSVLFDNQYFVKLMRGRGVLTIDAEMPFDSRTSPFVQKFANDQEAFFRSFSLAFVKLSSSNVLTGNQGVIRKACNILN